MTGVGGWGHGKDEPERNARARAGQQAKGRERRAMAPVLQPPAHPANWRSLHFSAFFSSFLLLCAFFLPLNLFYCSIFLSFSIFLCSTLAGPVGSRCARARVCYMQPRPALPCPALPRLAPWLPHTRQRPRRLLDPATCLLGQRAAAALLQFNTSFFFFEYRARRRRRRQAGRRRARRPPAAASCPSGPAPRRPSPPSASAGKESAHSSFFFFPSGS